MAQVLAEIGEGQSVEAVADEGSRRIESISGTIRERVKLKGEIRTLTSSMKMSGYILAGMPVAVTGVLLLASPTYMLPLFGWPYVMQPIGAGVSVLIGHMVMQKMVDIEV